MDFQKINFKKVTPEKDLTTKKFGLVTVLKPVGRVKGPHNKHIVWKCICACGKIFFARDNNLKQGSTRSCGCVGKESAKIRFRKHGLCSSPEYHTWQAMINRCTNKNNIGYHNYGGRGISVCDSWRSFKRFYQDMGDRPELDYRIDRIDNSKGYFKENCEWVTQSENNRNKRTNRVLVFNGVAKCVAAWCEITGINKSTIHGRLRLGWSVEKTLTSKVCYRK